MWLGPGCRVWEGASCCCLLDPEAYPLPSPSFIALVGAAPEASGPCHSMTPPFPCFVSQQVNFSAQLGLVCFALSC